MIRKKSVWNKMKKRPFYGDPHPHIYILQGSNTYMHAHIRSSIEEGRKANIWLRRRDEEDDEGKRNKKSNEMNEINCFIYIYTIWRRIKNTQSVI
jgi:hypothetical protein